MDTAGTLISCVVGQQGKGLRKGKDREKEGRRKEGRKKSTRYCYFMINTYPSVHMAN